MKPALFALSCFLSAFAVAAEPGAAPKYPRVSLPDTEVRALPKSAHGRSYLLSVGLPASYRTDTNRRYPVVFVTDGYWDFPTLWVSYLNLAYDKTVPEALVVGIGYADEHSVDEYNRMRLWELSPVRVGSVLDRNSGHAEEFLDSIEHEIIPFVEKEYRADPSFRVMAGSSMGGLFTLYAMCTKPALFQGYIAASPAVTVSNDWLFGYEAEFAKKNSAMNARLFMTGAEFEQLMPGIRRFDAQLLEHKLAGLTYAFRMIDGARHAGEKAESYMRGLQYVFEPVAPLDRQK